MSDTIRGPGVGGASPQNITAALIRTAGPISDIQTLRGMTLSTWRESSFAVQR